jgi:hypothetical protein
MGDLGHGARRVSHALMLKDVSRWIAEIRGAREMEKAEPKIAS